MRLKENCINLKIPALTCSCGHHYYRLQKNATESQAEQEVSTYNPSVYKFCIFLHIPLSGISPFGHGETMT